MKQEELKQLNEFRQDGETIEAAKARWDIEKAKLEKEAKLENEQEEKAKKEKEMAEIVKKTNEEKKEEVAILEKKENIVEVVDGRSYTEESSDFEEDDLIVPYYKIIQSNCRIEGCQQGKFLNVVSGEHVDKLENVVFLQRQKGRIMFPKGDLSGAIECCSDDNLIPSERIENPKNKKCSECEFSLWKKEDGKNIPSPCKLTEGFLGLEENFSPFSIKFHGLAMKPLQGLLSTLYLKTKLGIIQKKKLSLKSFSFTISLGQKLTDNGTFWVPVFNNIKEIEDDKKNLIDELYKTVNLIQAEKKIKMIEEVKETKEIETFKGNPPPF